MFCGECGTENPDTNIFCKNCGKPLRKTTAAAPAVPVADGKTQFPSPFAPAQPVYPVPSAGVGTQPPVPAGVSQQASSWTKGKKMAAASIVFGIIAFIFAPYFAALAGIILGALALREKERIGAAGIILAIAAIITENLAFVILKP